MASQKKNNHFNLKLLNCIKKYYLIKKKKKKIKTKYGSYPFLIVTFDLHEH